MKIHPGHAPGQNGCFAVASAIQANLLPGKSPLMDGLDISGACRYSSALGGDYFDYLDYGEVCCRSPEHIGIVIGDVAGHGVASALLMTTIRAYVRSRVTHPGPMDKVVNDVNRLVCKDVAEAGHFMTLFLMDIRVRQKEITWVRAGHEPGMVYDPETGCFEALAGKGMALGVDPDYVYSTGTRDGLKKGEIIAVGTDGVWEAMNSKRQMFGKSRFKDVIRENARGTSAALVASIFDSLDAFRQGTPLADDASIVIVKVV